MTTDAEVEEFAQWLRAKYEEYVAEHPIDVEAGLQKVLAEYRESRDVVAAHECESGCWCTAYQGALLTYKGRRYGYVMSEETARANERQDRKASGSE